MTCQTRFREVERNRRLVSSYCSMRPDSMDLRVKVKNRTKIDTDCSKKI
jgi:hypothetical protein